MARKKKKPSSNRAKTPLAKKIASPPPAEMKKGSSLRSSRSARKGPAKKRAVAQSEELAVTPSETKTKAKAKAKIRNKSGKPAKSTELVSSKPAPRKGSTSRRAKKTASAGASGRERSRRSRSRSAEDLSRAYFEIFRARHIDEKAVTLVKQNKCFFQIGCAGHEAIQVACADVLRPGSDWAYPYYRDMAFCAAWGMTNREFFLNILNRADDPNSGGRQMPMHYGHRGLNIVSQSSPTGTQLLQAVGTALGLRRLGQNQVVYVSCGEGTAAEGDFHEALNWAAREKLPVLFVIQDNKFAISVPVNEEIAGADVARLGAGYEGLLVEKVDGTDYIASYEAALPLVARLRKGEGPALLVADVVRLQSHSISDNQLKYRTAEDLLRDKERDPLANLRSLLLEDRVISEDDLAEREESVRRQIAADAEWAEAQPEPHPDSATRHVFGTSFPFSCTDGQGSHHDSGGDELFMVDAINHALGEELERDESVIVYGQDVARGKGGVFSVTAGLTEKFGSARVFNAPLAESSIAGTAIGLSVTGFKPVVEIQFGDYVWTAMMQLRNELALLRYRSNNAFSCPSVIRLAVGGYIHGGIYHSQNIEAFFSHIPGLVVAYPSNARDAYGMLKNAVRCKDPVLFLEHKGLYRQVYAQSAISPSAALEPLGKASIVKGGSDATVITWGALVHRSLEAAELLEREGYDIEVVDLRTISPFDRETVAESVKRTNRVLVAHEDVQFMGFGAEVSAFIAEHLFEYLDAPVQRLGGAFTPVPFAPTLERAVLPQVEGVRDALRKLVKY